MQSRPASFERAHPSIRILHIRIESAYPGRYALAIIGIGPAGERERRKVAQAAMTSCAEVSMSILRSDAGPTQRTL
jgi:hypothetical protein